MNNLVYIASPVRPHGGITIEENLEFAKRCCEYAINKGVAPVAPHLIYTQILDDSLESERKLGMEAGYVLLSHCDELWACGGVISEGMKSEIEFAENQGISVKYIGGEDIIRGI